MTTLNPQGQNANHNIVQLARTGDVVAQQPQVFPIMKFCTVMVDSLHIRTTPNSMSPIVASYSQGSVLNFTEVVAGEPVQGNPYWGHTVQNHYYWMGGTDRPQG